MMGQGDGLLDAGPLAGVTVPLEQLKRDYYDAMGWDAESGRLARQRAEQLGISELLQGQLA
jgi:aldehyde:ferredoxin oxidoreductase